MNRKTSILLATSLVVVFCTCHAQLVVEDPAAIAQGAVNQVVNLAKYVEMVNNQIQQIENMTQQLEQVSSLTRATGDPAQIINVTGAKQLAAGFQQSGVGKSMDVLQQNASGKQALESDTDGLYSSIGNTSLSGIAVQRATDDYKPYGAVENAVSNYKSVERDVIQRREELKAQIAETVTRLRASSTDAETQKLQGVLIGQAAQLHSLNQEIAEAASQAVVQGVANQNEQMKETQAQNEEIAADRHDALSKFGGMMQPDTGSDLRFGSSTTPK